MQTSGSRTLRSLRPAVEQLPSTMARLVLLAGLRDLNTGRYRYPGTPPAEQPEVDRLLRRLHEQAFACWLNYRLEEQKADLELYLSGLDCGKALAVRTWLELESYRWLVPASAEAPQRELFSTEVALLLELVARELGLTGKQEQAGTAGCAPRLLTARELSRWLRIPARTPRLWAALGEIPALKVGRQWRFPEPAIWEWISRRRREE